MNALELGINAVIALNWRHSDPVRWTAFCMALADRFPTLSEAEVIAKLDMLAHTCGGFKNHGTHTNATPR